LLTVALRSPVVNMKLDLDLGTGYISCLRMRQWTDVSSVFYENRRNVHSKNIGR